MALVSCPSASVAVEKATSDLLSSPDWTTNIDICDFINYDPSYFGFTLIGDIISVKGVLRTVKKRLQHKSSNVQLLALTLLETILKNCGDYPRSQIAEKGVLNDMVKIVKKKTNMEVRERILVLLNSWKSAFGGPTGKHPQYYRAFDELKRFGVEFPQISQEASIIFTPVTYSSSNGFSRTLHQVMAATERPGISLSSLQTMRNVMDLLNDMLQAARPNIDHQAVANDEIIADLVNQCRSNQKKLSQTLATIGEEELLGQGLDLNDSLQAVIEKHSAIASGSCAPSSEIILNPDEPDFSSTKLADSSSLRPGDLCKSVSSCKQNQVDEEDDEDDEFAHLARRHSRTTTATPAGSSFSFPSTSMVPISNPSMPDVTRNERDMIDLLSLTVSSTFTNSNQPLGSSPFCDQIPSSSQRNTYVVPWARPEPDHNQQRLSFQEDMPRTYDPPPRTCDPPPRTCDPPPRTCDPPPRTYDPPPRWPATPGYTNNQKCGSALPVDFGSAPGPNQTPSYWYAQQADRSLQKHDFSPAERSSGLASNGNALGVRPAQKPFTLPHMLFQDLNIMGAAAATVKDSRDGVSSTQGGGASSCSSTGNLK